MKTKTMLVSFALLSFGAFATELPADPAPVDNGALTTIKALDVHRYMGTWYEIAKFPNWFQRKCASHTKASYALKADGDVEVINECRLEDGGTIQAIGLARQVGEPTSPKLEVRFAPLWLSFIPAVWGKYWVIDLDADYQLVAVSEPKRDYLWILSRAPSVDKSAYNNLLERLARKGFDLQLLETTKQD